MSVSHIVLELNLTGLITSNDQQNTFNIFHIYVHEHVHVHLNGQELVKWGK